MGQEKRVTRQLSVRVATAGYSALAARAEREDVPVSLLVRRILAYGLATMPDGWVPPKAQGVKR